MYQYDDRECAKKVNGSDEWNITECKDAPYFCREGIVSMEGCQGAPVIMSTPHFLDADPSLHEAIEGVRPIREKHITFLDIEPNTGGLL